MKKIIFNLYLIIIALSSISCANIPREAPVLSQQLNTEIQELENSHLSLVHTFFELKRKNAKEYINTVWLPLFAENYFKQQDISNMWDLVVNEGSSEDRLQFILATAPALQQEINLQYETMIAPLDKLEYQLEKALEEKYTNARSINNTVTSFLFSASKIDENRQRYLDMVGISDDNISRTINKTALITEKMLNTANTVDNGYEEIQENIENYKEQLNYILNQI
ncbi:hypothetical protein SAMN05660776_2932 [Salegentibacter holothuriorum]|uniref:Uncharacterized protein n=1 Tax=Salegentibacter holothuriorum TaxID=241145 RepID=A0A1T5E0E7_9FLAO|nr:hypothetical protein [Salegentibacter holothuriorum]SKB77445.1 hypothetical protein SAMN05660776_2932 [Salegentibacter holothuriorum]